MQINEQPYISHFRSMAESTVEDVKHFVKEFNNYLKPSYLTEMYIKFLVELKHCKEGFPIDRYQHSLQTATRAYRDKRDNEYVVMCLLHDVAEVFDDPVRAVRRQSTAVVTIDAEYQPKPATLSGHDSDDCVFGDARFTRIGVGCELG